MKAKSESYCFHSDIVCTITCLTNYCLLILYNVDSIIASDMHVYLGN